MSKVFQSVGALHPGRSVFDLSYTNHFTTNFGQLHPVMIQEVVPGDIMKFGNTFKIRMHPMMAPVMHEINVFCHIFFTAYRNLFDGLGTGDPHGQSWVNFITGGEKSEAPGTPGYGLDGLLDVTLPRWTPTALDMERGSLWDSFGFPIFDIPSSNLGGVSPLAFPLRAYNMIWNEYYRDENLQSPRQFENYYNSDPNIQAAERKRARTLALRNYEKDYFTSCLPSQQKGVSPGFGLSGLGTLRAMNHDGNLNLTSDRLAFLFPLYRGVAIPPLYPDTTVDYPGQTVIMGGPYDPTMNEHLRGYPNVATTPGDGVVHNDDYYDWTNVAGTRTNQLLGRLQSAPQGGGTSFTDFLRKSLAVDLSKTVLNASIHDFRLAFQIQKWMERNMRAGTRYIEFLKAHYGVSPRDDRLDRPEYIGGSRSPVVITEVLQTSASDMTDPTPQSVQGGMAGHGISVTNSYCGRYVAKEFGIIMALVSILPRTSYTQGVNRQWLRYSRYDYFTPEFVNLSEQAVYTGELYANGTGDLLKGTGDFKPFGFQGRYDEMRINHNVFSGDFRGTLDYWHLGRFFGNAPVLNSDFIECRYEPNDRIFSVKYDSKGNPIDQFLVQWGNIIKAWRPLPWIAEPGLIDHH